jgi:hypothetical protein
MNLQAIVLGVGFAWLLSLSRGLQPWVMRLTLAVVACGVGVYFLADESYLNFSFFMVQAIAMVLATSFYTNGRAQKILMGSVIFILVAAHLMGPALALDSLNKIEYRLYLSVAYSLLPVLIFSARPGQFDNLKRVLIFQQTWLRVSFIYWSSSQAVNIHHYEIFERFSQELAYVSLGVMFFALLLKRQIAWPLFHQSVLSLFVFVISLYSQGHHQGLLLAWVFLMAISELFPRSAPERFKNLARILSRLEVGALGGGYFWTMIIGVAVTAESMSLAALLWTPLAFLLGVMAWVVRLPDSPETEAPTGGGLALFSRIVVQGLIALIFVFWPYQLI